MIEYLLALIVSMTGITRDVDPWLTAIAEARVIEVQSDRSHNGQRPGTWEVFQYNWGNDDPAREAAEWWMNSPPHEAALTNSSLTRIGCAADLADDEVTWYFVCALAAPIPAPPPSTGTAAAPTAPPRSSPDAAPRKADPTIGAGFLLPDTRVAREPSMVPIVLGGLAILISLLALPIPARPAPGSNGPQPLGGRVPSSPPKSRVRRARLFGMSPGPTPPLRPRGVAPGTPPSGVRGRQPAGT